MVEYYLGTMGFGYKDWEGAFYPQGMPARNYLPHYSRYFNAAEMDTTFYGTPRKELVNRWAAITPPEFRFCAKTPQKITHDLGLVSAHPEMAEFLNVMKLLGEKLGVILLQFPPSFSAEKFSIFSEFLAGLPKEIRFAVEFRHISWHNQRTIDLLQEHGICWAATEYPDLPREIHLTSNFLYIRWIGQHGSYDRHDFERVDLTDELLLWQGMIRGKLGSVSSLYGFFNNDYAGFAAATCSRFKKMLGLPVEAFQPAEQKRLF